MPNEPTLADRYDIILSLIIPVMIIITYNNYSMNFSVSDPVLVSV